MYPSAERYEQVHEELLEAITRIHGEEHAEEITERLIRNDLSGTLLVGIVENGNVLQYSRSEWTLRLVPVLEGGLMDGTGAHVVEWLESICEVEEWLRVNRGELLVWVHPRFGWVLEEDGE